MAALLHDLLASGRPVGVVAHVRTGPLVAGTPAAGWDVGHFACLAGAGATDALLADSYASLTEPGRPLGCRAVPFAALEEALGASPGRGLLLLVAAAEREEVEARVRRAGLAVHPWST